MSTSWQSACVSLDDSLNQIRESLEKLRVAREVNLDNLMEQLAVAMDAAHSLRSVVSSSKPEATWQTRAELDALLMQIEKISNARNRLLALATELERGSIVHRRAVRANLLNQLRDAAINDLRLQADAKDEPLVLPGPEASRWIEWACALKEPEDNEVLQNLRRGFASLDNFIANLEPGMWVVKSESAV